MPEKKPPYKPDPELEKTHPHLKEFFAFMYDLQYESHRGAVLLSCAYLDGLLREILCAFFLPGKQTNDLL